MRSGAKSDAVHSCTKFKIACVCNQFLMVNFVIEVSGQSETDMHPPRTILSYRRDIPAIIQQASDLF